VNPLVEFDVILIIDPWGKDWYLKEKFSEKPPWLYRRIASQIESVVQKSPNIFVSCDLHLVDDLLKGIVPPIKAVTTLEGLEEHIKLIPKKIEGNTNILVIGAAWQMCLHYADLGIVNLMDAGYTVWTQETMVDTSIDSIEYVSEKLIMENRGVIWKKWNNGFYEAIGIDEEDFQIKKVRNL